MNANSNIAVTSPAVYVAYVCGNASIREMGTDRILATLKGKAPYDAHLNAAKRLAARNGWKLV